MNANAVCLLPNAALGPKSIHVLSSPSRQIYSSSLSELFRPLFLFPGGVHLMATLGMALESILHTCPIHVHLLNLMTPDKGERPVLLYSSSLEIVLGQNILSILLRHLVWNTSNW